MVSHLVDYRGRHLNSDLGLVARKDNSVNNFAFFLKRVIPFKSQHETGFLEELVFPIDYLRSKT